MKLHELMPLHIPVRMLGLIEEINHIRQALIEELSERLPRLLPNVNPCVVHCSFGCHSVSLPNCRVEKLKLAPSRRPLRQSTHR